MMKVYDVYEKRYEARILTWAYALDGGLAFTLKGDSDRGFVSAQSKPAELGRLVQKHLRAGYRFIGKGMFFDEDMQCFSKMHPDFVRTTKNGKYILYAQVPSIEASALRVDANLDRAIANHILEPEVGREWIKAIEQGTEFLVASDAHPLWSLLIAEEALGNDAKLTSVSGGAPTSLPSQTPSDWEIWLTQFFSKELITRSLKALAWGLPVSSHIPDVTSEFASVSPAFAL